MTALRILTWNVHLPSARLALVQGLPNTAVTDAEAIAARINGLPVRERPDVVAFNEVYHGAAREKLLEQLPTFPHHTGPMGTPLVPPVLEDSGLLLVSRYPLMPMQDDGTRWAFDAFDDARDTDMGSRKGVGLVSVAVPPAPVLVAFTHMQASYEDDNTDYRHIRRRQLAQVMRFLARRLGSDTSFWRQAVVVGDLNIKGDAASGTAAQEYDQVFGSGTVSFGTVFDDAWRTYVSPPATDPGHTNADRRRGLLHRLDYQCVVRSQPIGRRLVPHHVSVPLQDSSDHFGVLSRLQLFTSGSTLPTAVDVLAVAPDPGPSDEAQSTFRQVECPIAHPGGYQWLRLSRPGTYTVFHDDGFEIATYAEDDVTHPLAPAGQLTGSQLPGVAEMALQRSGMLQVGDTHALRAPGFLRVRATTEEATGQATVGVLEHLGDSMATAIRLPVNGGVAPVLPAGQRLGAEGLCYLRADLPETFSGQPYDSTFLVRNPERRVVGVGLVDPGGNALRPAVQSADPVVGVVHRAGSGTLFVVLERSSVDDTSFKVEWEAPLTFLRLTPGAFGLVVDDESGPLLGADHLRLSVTLDGVGVAPVAWDDADTGEEWPGLREQVVAVVGTQEPAYRHEIPGAGFVAQLEKVDSSFAYSPPVALLGAVTEGPVERTRTRLVIDQLHGDGRYTLTATIARFPSGQAPSPV